MKEHKPTTLGHALLGLIHMEPRSGYDLKKVFESTPMGHYSSSPGAIYPALRRLEAGGLIIGERQETGNMRPRTRFHCTKAGRTALVDWVCQAVDKYDVIWREHELMLRFAFMDSLVSKQKTLEFLEQMLAGIEEYLPELEEHATSLKKEKVIHGRLALESGIEKYRTQAEWARTAIRQLS